MPIDIIEDLQNGSLDRPLKGLMLENGIHLYDTKQEILDEQTISNGRVANAVIFARDIKKFLIFDEAGESYEEKDVPGGSGNAYHGQGLGTPKPISVGNGDKYLTAPVGYYISQPDKTGNLTIYVNDTDGYNEFRVIYDNADNKTRDVKVSADGIKETTQTVDTGEVWECRVTLSRDSLDGNTFFWARIDNATSYNNLFVGDHRETVVFDQSKEAVINEPKDIRYEMSDGATRLYNSGEVTVYLDSDKPVGVMQFENLANYHWDYPEITVKLYVDNDQTELGGFRVPYGFGVVMKYNLDNKEELNLFKGYWTWSMFVVDWSVIQKVASSEGQFASFETAYLGLFGDEGAGDERVFYPAMTSQDSNGWTQEEFTGTKVIRHKDKDTGAVGDKIMELGTSRITNHVQPYYGDLKLQARTNNPVYRTVSKSDLIGDDDKPLNEWVAENPGYTPIEFVDRLFSSKVMGYTNWEASITLSNETFNGTLPLGYTQFRVFRTGGSSRSFMYLHNKESHTVMYAPYKSGVAPVFRKIAYTDQIEELISDALDDLIDPPEPDELTAQYVFEDSKISKGYLNGHTSINPFGYDDTHNRIAYDYRNESSANARSLFQVLTIKNKSIGYMMLKDDRLKDVLSASGIYVPPNLKNEYGVRVPTGTMIRLGGTGSAPVNPTSGGKYDYRGLAIPNLNPNTGAIIDPNRQSNDVFLDNDANIVTDMSQANSHFRTERELGQVSQGNAGEDMNFALRRGVIIFSKDGDKSDAFFIDDGNSPWYIMTVELNTVASNTEQYTAVVYKNDPSKSIAKINLYPSPFVAALDGDTLVTSTAAQSLIESNNDEIITPSQGTQFQLIDDDKSSGYGDNGEITYYPPNYTTGQAAVLTNHIDNSKSYFVHKATSSSLGFAILHESYVSQIYNKDVTGISELTMLFGPKSRARYAKNNQVTPAGMVLNWNGDYLPDTEDANAVNPTSWIDLDGNITTDWSSSGIKTACYSSGLMANDGSALLQRGDVFCHNDAGVKTSTFTADSASEFFVIPIRAGGGTFNDLKLFPLFMSRFYKLQNEWDSYTFDNSADCVGTILKIAYDAAIEAEAETIESEETQLLAGIAGGQLFVNQITVG